MATAELEAGVETQTTETKEALDWALMTPAQKEAALKTVGAGTTDDEEEGEPTAIEDEETETQETPAAGDETPAGDDAAEPLVKEGEGEGEPEVGAKDWRDDETREFVAMMGLTDADLSDFGSREELDRALRIIDRKAFEAGKAGLEPPAGQQQTQQQQVQQPEAKKPVVPQQQQTGDPLADLSQFKLGEAFDEDAAAPINRFVEAATATIKDLQTRLAQFEQSAVEESVADIERRAVDSIHSLGHPELFGKPGERPTKEQAENVKRAIRAHFIHARGLIDAGRQVSPTPAFLKAAVHLEFGDELLKNQKKQQIQALQKQSARRTGGPAAKPVPETRDWDEMTDAQKAAAVRKIKKDKE